MAIEISRWYVSSQVPTAPISVPSETKTNVKPSTNSPVPASMRPRWAAPPDDPESIRSAPDSPVTYET